MRKNKGEAIVEFALLAPLLILLLMALVDFGRVFDAWLISTNAAREGARYGAVYASQDYITAADVRTLSTQKAFDYLTSGLDGRTDVTFAMGDIAVALPSKTPGEPVTVSVTVRVEILFLPAMFLPNPTGVQGQATMRI